MRQVMLIYSGVRGERG